MKDFIYKKNYKSLIMIHQTFNFHMKSVVMCFIFSVDYLFFTFINIILYSHNKVLIVYKIIK